MRIFKCFIFIVILVNSIFIFSGCLPRYGIANSGSDPIYFTKPMFKDSSISSNYFGGKYSHSIDSGYRRNETNYFSEIYLFRSNTMKFFNFSYGIYGYGGSYKVVNFEKFKGNKYYYGGGISSEANLHSIQSLFDLRYIGIKGSIIYEDGDYRVFRLESSKDKLTQNINGNTLNYNISTTSEIVLKLKNSILGLYGSIGVTKSFYQPEGGGFITQTFCMHYTYKTVTAYVQLTKCIFGIGNLYSLGLNYELK